MADQNLKRSFRSRDGAPFVIFLILSLVTGTFTLQVSFVLAH